jgi:hypothetical protein
VVGVEGKHAAGVGVGAGVLTAGANWRKQAVQRKHQDLAQHSLCWEHLD